MILLTRLLFYFPPLPWSKDILCPTEEYPRYDIVAWFVEHLWFCTMYSGIMSMVYVVFRCGLALASCLHILHSSFTGTGAVIRLTGANKWRQSDEYGQIDLIDPVQSDIITARTNHNISVYVSNDIYRVFMHYVKRICYFDSLAVTT